MRKAALLLSLPLVALVTGCGGGSTSATSTPSASAGAVLTPEPSASPTTPIDELVNALEDTSTAEETWLGDHDAYTTKVDDLVKSADLVVPKAVSLTLTATGSDGYCIQATHTGLPGKVSHLISDLDHGIDLFEGPCTAGRATPLQGTPTPSAQELLENQILDVVTAEESALTNGGATQPDVSKLSADDYKPNPKVSITVSLRGKDSYCVQGTSKDTGTTSHYDVDEGQVADGPCGAAASS